jgi:hypothetical protein
MPDQEKKNPGRETAYAVFLVCPRNDCKEFDNALSNFFACCQFHEFLQASGIAERHELKAAKQLF